MGGFRFKSAQTVVVLRINANPDSDLEVIDGATLSMAASIPVVSEKKQQIGWAKVKHVHNEVLATISVLRGKRTKGLYPYIIGEAGSKEKIADSAGSFLHVLVKDLTVTAIGLSDQMNSDVNIFPLN
jgi:hypothetical protein